MNARQRRAKTAIDELSLLGLSQREIAQRLNFDPTYVAHINGIAVHPEYHVSEERAKALESLVLGVRHEKAMEVIQKLPIAVRETANNEGTPVDQSVRDRVCEAIRLGLTHLATDGTSAAVELPLGVHGAFAEIGPNVRLFINTDGAVRVEEGNARREEQVAAQIKMLQGAIERCRLQIHEIQHQIDELRRELPDDKRPYRPKAAY
jgi:hypothetical protein